MQHFAVSDPVSELAEEVATLMQNSGRRAALRHLMDRSEQLLRTPTDELRVRLRKEVFRKIPGIGYQGEDFESTDYDQYELAPDLALFRGPPVSEQALANGEYFCVMGAAQTFGRLVHKSWPELLSEAIGLPVVNLSGGGKGPEFFLNAKLVEVANRARFVVVQAMSGRSVGCSEYPGGRYITRGSKRTKLQRRTVLRRLWNQDPKIAIHYVRRWNASYLDLYSQLRAQLTRPTSVAWISERDPDGWSPEQLLQKLDWGLFPQLVGRELYDSVTALFDAHFELVYERVMEQPVSRSTGEPCPYFRPDRQLHSEVIYYPTSAANAALAEALVPWARKALVTA